MNMSYPVTLKSYRGGRVGAFFADVPEAITAGTNEAEALDRAQDALLVALSSYLDDGRPLPVPSKAKRGQPVVVLPLRAAIKLAIHEAMCEQGVTQAQLGEMLGIDGRQVRRTAALTFTLRQNSTRCCRSRLPESRRSTTADGICICWKWPVLNCVHRADNYGGRPRRPRRLVRE